MRKLRKSQCKRRFLKVGDEPGPVEVGNSGKSIDVGSTSRFTVRLKKRA